jgi:oligoribonuclease (3'-5' exoribonuclease)
MTGLDYKTDRIIEIAVSASGQSIYRPDSPWFLTSNVQVLITNGNLDIVDDGIEFIIHTEKSVLDKFDRTPTVWLKVT